MALGLVTVDQQDMLHTLEFVASVLYNGFQELAQS